MSIAAIGATSAVSPKPPIAPVAPIGAKKPDGAGPDRNRDSDNAGVKSAVQSAPPPGTGKFVNKTA